MPDFVIGRSGYDLYLVQEGYLDSDLVMIDMTNTGNQPIIELLSI